MDDLDRSLPDKQYKASRRVRSLLFSLVVATVGVGILIVVIQFVWNSFLAPALDRPPYLARVEFVVPAILIIAYLLHRLIWEASEGPPPPKAA